jgi:F0F1-type ATP synthase membrane subunit b/b'
MIELDAEFWVAVAFVAFVGGLIYLGVHEMMLKFIDQRRDRIKADLDEALRKYERGLELAALCRQRLTDAENPADRLDGILIGSPSLRDLIEKIPVSVAIAPKR